MSGSTDIKRSFIRSIQSARSLAGLTTFRIGGPAFAFISCESIEDIQRAIAYAEAEGKSVRPIGGGSNLLIDDAGVDAVVIDISKLKSVQHEGTRVIADAGAKLTSVIGYAARKGLAGIEGIAGIPGTIGGAIAMNAGGKYGEIGDAVEAVDVITQSGDLIRMSKAELNFGYRCSSLNNGIVVRVFLQLDEGESRSLTARAAEISRAKVAAQPYTQFSAGCIFRNPQGSEHGAGKLVDMAGLKGERAGDAMISDRHANFIVNCGEARAADVISLIERAQARVENSFGVKLQTEVKRWAA